MYHIWKISKIISSETRGNKQAEMKPKVAKRITTSQPHPTTLPPRQPQLHSMTFPQTR